MKKALILVALLLVLFIGEMLMFENDAKDKEANPYIAVTNFAIYEIINTIAGNHIEVKKLVPFGVETHTYIPSVKTIAELSRAELFAFNGLGMEPWIKKEYPNQMNMSKFVKLRSEGEEEEHEGHEGHDHGDEDADPHYWLDIENMILMTRALTKELSKHFPQHEQEFENNSKSYINALTTLGLEYSNGLKNCARREIVVNHNAFAYLGERYGFDSHSITGLSPDEQASAKKMKEITDLLSQEKFNTIFFESFVSPKLAQTIAKETGVKVESLQPLANVTQEEAKKGYIALMRENLRKLSAAMECE
jgi:zinc transport system substrate-binding protein